MLGYYQPAFDYFKAACEKQEYNIEFQNKLAVTLTQLQRFEEAKKIYEEIVTNQPKYEPAWSNLGFLFLRERDFERAELCFNKALALNPDYELALLNKATVFFHTQRNKEAKELVERVLKINPQNPQAQAMLQELSQF
jgi:tetratricopeptide (TPR) repeat protein